MPRGRSITCLLAAFLFVVLPSGVIAQIVQGPPRVVAMQRLMDAAADGPLPVIVRLRLAHSPEHRLTVPAARAQRIAIAAVQDRLTARLARTSDRSIKRYPFLPALALSVTRDELAQLAADPDVEAIQEDGIYYPTLNESTAIIGSVDAAGRGFTGTGQTIAILDSGVDKTHTFLTGKVVSEACYSTTLAGPGLTTFASCPGAVQSSTAPGSGVPCVGPSNCFHGTHVAGIAAGSGAVFSGAARGANIIAIQIFSLMSTGDIAAFFSDVDLALQRVYELHTTFNISSVNLSLGGGQFFGSCDAELPTTKSAIDLLRAAGIATVISSGNDGWTDSVTAPGCISTAVTVGSTTKADDLWDSSNMGPLVDLLAPGSFILSSLPGGGFGVASGTSMAAPHVAGAWALMKQRKPSATVAEILQAFQNTGVLVTDTRQPFNLASIGVAAGFARKRINVQQALSVLVTGPEDVTLADFDGDGRDDVLLYNGTSGVWSIRRTTAAGGLEDYRAGGWSPGWTIHKADFDNDGLDDLLLHNVTTGLWFKVMNNGTEPFTYIGGGWIAGLVPHMAQLNSDALTDVFLYSPTTGDWFKAITVDAGRAAFSYAAGGWRAGWTLHAADFNDDALTDFFLFDEVSGTWFKAIGNGAEGFSYHLGGWLTGYDRMIVDLNGDGKSDIFLINRTSGTWFKCFSTGDGTLGFAYETGGWLPGFTVFPANFDGNAATDFFLYNQTNGGWYKVVNNGTSFSYTAGGWAIWRVAAGDMTTDGRTDFLLFSPSSGTWFLAATTGVTGFSYTSGEW